VLVNDWKVFLVCCMAWVLVSALPVGAQAVPERHPRVMITPEMVKEMARKVRGPFADEYRVMLETAKGGPRFMENSWSIPGGFMESGLAYLIEKQLGRDGKPYAEAILAMWRKPEWQKPGLNKHFGWQGLLYDWIYDAMTPQERRKFGQLLGEWVQTWWRVGPHVDIPRSGWWYNQHWGPSHLDRPHNRVALTSKLLISLATLGNAGKFESAVKTNAKEFYDKFREIGLPALDEMGGIWAESNGHGGYGPTYTVPLAYQALRTGTDFDPYAASAPHGFAPEYIRAGIYCLMPHNDKMAYIDDGNSGYPVNYARCAPMFARAYNDGVARWLSDKALKSGWLYNRWLQKDEVWQRIAFMPADLKPVSPKEAGWPLAYHFRGAGHVYMRGAWDDPDATFAFFGAGPSFAAHSRDDEGTFLITKKGQLVNRSGGQGHNDGCYYTGGSLVNNIVTIYAPEEKMRRSAYNENDGGLLRYVYDGPYPKERGHITAYWHDDQLATYAAADLTKGYWSEKAKEVTRQFLYLRGKDEAFVVFDRVESTRADYPKVWFLHLPSEPEVSGAAEVKVPDHVTRYAGDTATWVSDEAGDTGLLTEGKSRLMMKALAPAPVRITKRGGKGHDFWGHPYNPEAQYNHTLDKNGKESDAYLKPTFSPWRLEVEPTTRNTRDYFLNVFFVTDEGARSMPAIERLEEGNSLGARISLGEREVTVRFNKTGAISGHLTITEAGRTIHDAELPTTVPKD